MVASRILPLCARLRRKLFRTAASLFRMGLSSMLDDSDPKMAQGEGRRKHKICGIVTITCCWLIHCTLGVSYSFGNLDPYLTSYLRNLTASSNVDYTDTLWIIQSTGIFTCLLMPIVGLMSTNMHTKLYLFIGALFSAAAMFGTYWSVQISFTWTVVTYGLFGGVAQAILYPAPVNIVAKWMPNNVGFVTGLILTGYGLGAFMWNFLITWYINPNNLQPNVKVGDDVYYSQSEVLEKVPSCFLVLGGVFTAIQLLSLILVCEAPASPNYVEVYDNDIGGADSELLLGSDEEEMGRMGHRGSLDVDSEVLGTLEMNGDVQHSGPPQPHQYHPTELLRSRVFWTMWWMVLTADIGTAFVINLFKAYGQTFIPDDHFLSLVASFSSICNAAGRPFWGLLADRVGPRTVSLYCLGILTFLVATFVTCEMTGRAAFFIWTCGMFLSMCGLFTMFPTLTYRLFGVQYFNANLGLVNSEGVLGSLGAALMAPILKEALGWHGVFYFSYALVFLSLLLNMSLDLRCGLTIPRTMYAALSIRR